jgi:RepB DNA-primase from phage plasmid
MSDAALGFIKGFVVQGRDGELFEPGDNTAILVRNRRTRKTVQRITTAVTIAGPEFQAWLAARNAAGSDVYVGMNPIKEGAYTRTEDNTKDVRHIYLDLDTKGDEVLDAIRKSTEVPTPNFVLDTSPGKHQVVWRVAGINQSEAESLQHSLANQFEGDRAATDSTRSTLTGVRQPKTPRRIYRPSTPGKRCGLHTPRIHD